MTRRAQRRTRVRWNRERRIRCRTAEGRAEVRLYGAIFDDIVSDMLRSYAVYFPCEATISTLT